MTANWTVYDYETDMFKNLYALRTSNALEPYPHHVRNAVTESVLLHTRILVDILLDRDTLPDAIGLNNLLPGFSTPTFDGLKQVYGTRSEEGTPCWTLNKMLAHATGKRSDTYDYTVIMDKLRPVLQRCLDEIETKRKGGNQVNDPKRIGPGSSLEFVQFRLTTSSEP